MTEPTPLDREQLQPIIDALHKRDVYAQAGAGFLVPLFAPCPTCGEQPTELFVNRDHYEYFIKDEVLFGFRPCGHNFTATGDDIYDAYTQARQQERP